VSRDREEAATEAVTAHAPEVVAVEMEAATQRLREQAWMLNAMSASALLEPPELEQSDIE
jgi:hypothetical protein